MCNEEVFKVILILRKMLKCRGVAREGDKFQESPKPLAKWRIFQPGGEGWGGWFCPPILSLSTRLVRCYAINTIMPSLLQHFLTFDCLMCNLAGKFPDVVSHFNIQNLARIDNESFPTSIQSFDKQKYFAHIVRSRMATMAIYTQSLSHHTSRRFLIEYLISWKLL